MMSTRSLLIAVAALVLIGLLAVAALRSIAPPTDAPPAADAGNADAAPAEPAAAPPAAALPAAATADAGEAPPWASAAGVPATPTDATTTAEAKRAAQLAQLQTSVTTLANDALERSMAGNEHVRKTLDTLEAMDDPAVKAQVDLAAVRHNFEISVRMQALVRELQAQMAGPRTPERQQRIDALKREFETLRAQLRTDITPPGAPLPVPAPAGQ